MINPSKETLDKLKSRAPLTDEQTQEFNKAYAAVTGADPHGYVTGRDDLNGWCSQQ